MTLKLECCFRDSGPIKFVQMMTLYFMARSDSFFRLLYGKQEETEDFSDSVVACDIKVD